MLRSLDFHRSVVWALFVGACLPSSFEQLAEGASSRSDASIDASSSGTHDASTGDGVMPSEPDAEAPPPSDAEVSEQTEEFSLTSDGDDGHWCTQEGKLVELLHFSPDEGAAGFTLEAGTDSEACRAGLRFVLPFAPGTRIVSAVLQLYRVGPEDNTDAASTLRVQVFEDTAAMPLDASHVHDTPAQHAEGGLWPTWVGGFQVGPTDAQTESPELRELVQHVIDKPTWRPGGTVMFLLSPDAMPKGQFAQFRDSYAAEYPPRLTVRYK